MSQDSQPQPPEPQREARRLALWVLYGMDITSMPAPVALQNALPMARELVDSPEQYWPRVQELVIGVAGELAAYDARIQAVSPRWKVRRMAAVDRNLLRLGIFEILDGLLAPIVIINGCVDLAKTFGETSTPGFVNGLLDEFCKTQNIKMHHPYRA